MTETFMDRLLSGEVETDALDEYIESWHTREGSGDDTAGLAAYLGMTRWEYDVVSYDPSRLPMVIEARRLAFRSTDYDVNAAYVHVGRGVVVSTVEITPEILLDLDADGRALGVELLNASTQLI